VTLRNAPRATRFDKLATTFADSAKLQAKGRLGSQLTGWRKVIWASIAFLDTSADEAIQLLELHDDIRVVFTDINMPGSMDGLEVSPLRSGTLATDQTHHHLWPAETACRRHAGWKRIHR
jgi:hypothetical protein